MDTVLQETEPNATRIYLVIDAVIFPLYTQAMIPVIVGGGTAEERAKYVGESYQASDYLVTHIVAEKTAITIAQVHDLIRTVTSSMPEKKRLVWIENAQQATLPAQNALLKILEEPPHNTQFVLTTISKNALLPTICSRCQITIIDRGEETTGDGAELAVIKQGLTASDGERITLASSMGSKKDILVEWTERCLHDIAHKVRHEKSPSSLRILTTIAALVHSAHSDLKANVSPTLCMQHLFVSLPRVKRG